MHRISAVLRVKVCRPEEFQLKTSFLAQQPKSGLGRFL